MSVKIGHASTDKDKKVGDSSGKEVCTRDWYSYPKVGWTCLLRPKNSNLANNIARMCELGCANNKIGYSQARRNTLWQKFKTISYNISKVGACDCDCSSFATVCAIGAGANITYGTNAPTTSTMRKVFKATGQFEVLTDKKYLSGEDYLKRGDILVAEGHHTVIVLSNGSKATTTSTTTSTTTTTSGSYKYKGVDYARVFDPTYYADNNADVKKAFGTNATKLFEHFCNYGMKEGRQAIKTFNVKVYKARYTDLADAYGDNLPKYYEHYCVYGYKENRKCI